jgi:hypothetical protein
LCQLQLSSTCGDGTKMSLTNRERWTQLLQGSDLAADERDQLRPRGQDLRP